jgi:hypothetical protein
MAGMGTQALLECLDTLGAWATETQLPPNVEQHRMRCSALRHKLMEALVACDPGDTAHGLHLVDRVRGGKDPGQHRTANPINDAVEKASTNTQINDASHADISPEEQAAFETTEGREQRQRVMRRMTQIEQDKVSLPENFAKFTLLSLGGPFAYRKEDDPETEGTDGLYLALLWVTLGALGGLSVAWTAGRTLYSIDPSLAYATYMWGLFSVVTVLGSSCSMIWLWMSTQRRDTEIIEDVHWCKGDPDTFFSSLMAMKIDASAQKVINQTRRFGWAITAAIMILFESFILWLWLDWDDLTNGADLPWDMYAGMIIGFVCLPIWTLGLTRASILLPQVLVQCLGERAEELSSHISQPAWPRTTTDYDDLLSDIDRFTMRTRKLSKALAFTCVIYPVTIGILAALFLLALALGPRPPHDSGHWFNETVTEVRCIILALVCVVYGFYSLFLPAHLTEKCRGIEIALSTNRIKKESGMVKFAVVDNLIRIHGLETHIDVQEVGFCEYCLHICFKCIHITASTQPSVYTTIRSQLSN